jgi:hypothetical protein
LVGASMPVLCSISISEHHTTWYLSSIPPGILKSDILGSLKNWGQALGQVQVVYIESLPLRVEYT